MATRRNINIRSKRAENRVSKYLWGHLRDWKEQHDVYGPDCYSRDWTGEIKNHSIKGKGLKGIYTILQNALEQVLGLGFPERLCFAVLIPPGCKVEDAFVLRLDPDPIVNYYVMETLKQFKENIILGWGKGPDD